MSRDTRFRLIFVVGMVIMMAVSLVIVQFNRAYHLYHSVYYQAVWVAIGVVLLLGVGALIVRTWVRQGFANIRPQIRIGQFVVLAIILYGLILAIHNLG